MQIKINFGKSSFHRLCLQMFAVTYICVAVADQGHDNKDSTPVEHVSPTHVDETSDPGVIAEDISVLHNDRSDSPNLKYNVNQAQQAVLLCILDTVIKYVQSSHNCWYMKFLLAQLIVLRKKLLLVVVIRFNWISLSNWTVMIELISSVLFI